MMSLFDEDSNRSSFDESEFDPAAEETENEASGVDAEGVVSLLVQDESRQPDATSPEDYMDDVDRRLGVASCYRELIHGSIFADESEYTAVVEAEIRDFVRGRLRVLMGVDKSSSSPAVHRPQFTEAEARALKVQASALGENIGRLKVLASLSDREVAALSLLAAAALKNRSISQTKPEPRRETQSPPTIKPKVAQRSAPAPEPPRQAPRVAARRSQSAPTQAPKRPTGDRSVTKKVTVESPDGKLVEKTVQKNQIVSTRTPFPTGTAFEATQMVGASLQAAVHEAAANKALTGR